MVQQKVGAFREFSNRLAQQLIDLMCGEFEREVQELWNDVCMYREELNRVAQLLGSQLEREKKLHGVIEQMMGHSANVQSQAEYLAQQRAGPDQIHQILDQYVGHHQNLMNQTIQGVGEANQALMTHYQGTQGMREQAISAENEFMRIVNLLQNPPVHSVPPATMVSPSPGPMVNGQGSYTPPSGNVTSSPGPPGAYGSGPIQQMPPMQRPPFAQAPTQPGVRPMGPPGVAPLGASPPNTFR